MNKWWQKSIILNILILLVVWSVFMLMTLLSGCSAEKRLQRLVNRNPQLLQYDTVKITDTAYTDRVVADTFYSIHAIQDTVLLEKEKLRIKTVYKNDTLYVSGECESDTVIMYKEVPIEKVVVKELTWWEKNRAWLIPLLIVLGGGIILKNEAYWLGQGLTTLENINDTRSWLHIDIRWTNMDTIKIVRP